MYQSFEREVSPEDYVVTYGHFLGYGNVVHGPDEDGYDKNFRAILN